MSGDKLEGEHRTLTEEAVPPTQHEKGAEFRALHESEV